jgi:ATP synthase protein I
MPNGQTGKSPADWIRQIALAMDLPFVLIGAVVGGGLVGYFLDKWLHTSPWLMLVCGLLGFIGGVRNVLQALTERGKTSRGDDGDGGGDGKAT